MSDALKNWDYTLPILLLVGVPLIMILAGGYIGVSSFLNSKKNKLPMNFKKISIAIILVIAGAGPVHH